MEIEQYMHGDCHIFALGLQEEFGYKIQFALDYDEDLGKEVLIHAYCVDGEDKIDIEGRGKLEQVLESFDYNEPYYRDVSKKEVKKLIEAGFIHEPYKGQEKEVQGYIRKNRENFIKR